MSKSIDKNQILTCSFLLLCGIAFLGQDYWFISDWDDIFYKFIVSDPSQGCVWQLMQGQHEYVQSFGDILYSQYNHYIGSNGRFIVHCIVQACTSFLTNRQFAYINSFVFLLLLWGMLKLADGTMQLRNAMFLAFSLAVLSPLTMADFFGNIAWSVNYLWSATATIWWLIMYERVIDEDTYSKGHLIALFVISILVGSLQESFCIGLCVGLGIYHLLTIKQLSWNKAIVVGGYIMGSCLCIFSPANWNKVEDAQKGLSVDALLDFLMTYSILLFCILLFVCYISSRQRLWDFVKANSVMFIAFVFTLCFCFFFTYHGSRQYTLSTLLSIVLIIRLIDVFDYKYFKLSQYIIIFSGTLLCVAFYPQMYRLRRNLGEAYYAIVDKEMETKSRVVFNAPYEIARYEIEQSVLNSYFHINTFNGNPESRYLSIHVSGGTDMNYITGVLPVTLDEMERKCASTTDKAKVACLYNHIYACCIDKKYPPNDVVWHYQTTFRNPYKWHNFFSFAQYRVAYKGKYYYIFHVGKNTVISESLEIKRK